MRVPLVVALVVASLSFAGEGLGTAANSNVTPIGALEVATEIGDQEGLVVSAIWLATSAVTTGGNYESEIGHAGGYSDDTITSGMTYEGAGFGILSSGKAGDADDPNMYGDPAGTSGIHGNVYRGAIDASVLWLTLDVPLGHNCLYIDFQFLSEEYKFYYGSTFNDGFIAELDSHTWQSNPATGQLDAPDNFAFDDTGAIISINSGGATAFSFGAASGSTYNGATGKLTAQTRILPPGGTHDLYLSVFDAADALYDSAVFLDNLRTDRVPRPAEYCKPGVEPPPPPVCEDGADPEENPITGLFYCPWLCPDGAAPLFTAENPNGYCPPPPPPFKCGSGTNETECNPGEQAPAWWLPDPIVPVYKAAAVSEDIHIGSRGGDRIDRDIAGLDQDRDGVPDRDDLCPFDGRSAYEDADSDGIGDACDADADGDGVRDDYDPCPEGDCTPREPLLATLLGNTSAEDVTLVAQELDLRGGAQSVFVNETVIAESKAGQGPIMLAILGGAMMVLLLAIAVRRA